MYEHVKSIQLDDQETDLSVAIEATLNSWKEEWDGSITDTTSKSNMSTTESVRGITATSSQLVELKTSTISIDVSVVSNALPSEFSSLDDHVDKWRAKFTPGAIPPSVASSPSRDETFHTASDGRASPPPSIASDITRGTSVSVKDPTETVLATVAVDTGPPNSWSFNPPSRPETDGAARDPHLAALELRLNKLERKMNNQEHSEDLKEAWDAIRVARGALLQARSSADFITLVPLLIEDAEREVEEAMVAAVVRASIASPSNPQAVSTVQHQLAVDIVNGIEDAIRHLSLDEQQPPPVSTGDQRFNSDQTLRHRHTRNSLLNRCLSRTKIARSINQLLRRIPNLRLVALFLHNHGFTR